MRAKCAPGALASASSASPIAGARRVAAACRSLRPALSAAIAGAAALLGARRGEAVAAGRSAGRQPELSKNGGGRQRDARIGQRREERRHVERRAKPLAPPRHQPRARGKAHRHVGADGGGGLAQARVVGRESCSRSPARAAPRRRRSIRRQFRRRPAETCAARSGRAAAPGRAERGPRPRAKRDRPAAAPRLAPLARRFEATALGPARSRASRSSRRRRRCCRVRATLLRRAQERAGSD